MNINTIEDKRLYECNEKEQEYVKYTLRLLSEDQQNFVYLGFLFNETIKESFVGLQDKMISYKKRWSR